MSKDHIARSCICCGGKVLNKSPAILMPFVAKRVFDHEPVMVSPEWGMQDLQTGMAYSVCNTIQCSDCGVTFLDIRFSDNEMAALYADYRGEEYERLRIHYEPGYARRAAAYTGRFTYIDQMDAFLRPLVPAAPAILDWGGDTGRNTPLLEQASLVHVYDISNVATVDGVSAVSMDIVKQTRYDLIVCNQVLEHVPYPFDFIAEMATVMDDDTILCIGVPYENLMRSQPASREIYKQKHHWHEHINFFSAESLQKMVVRAGLRPVEMILIDAVQGDLKGCIAVLACRRA